MTQAELADKLSVNRSLIGAYEEGRAEPKINTLQLLCHLFKIELGNLIEKPVDSNYKADISGSSLRILSISVDSSGEELIPLIPQKAAAGYTQGYADTEYLEQLKSANLPFPELQKAGTMRIFQIEGDSMLPIQPGSYIIAEFVENWDNIKNDECYILITVNDGIVYKRLENEITTRKSLRLKSDNTLYKPYSLSVNEVLEVWLAKGILSFEIPNSNANSEIANQILLQKLDHLQTQLSNLNQKVERKL